MNYPEYQVGRILERPTYENRTIVKREDDMIYVRADKSNDVHIWMLCEEVVRIWKLVPLKESPMAWLTHGTTCWVVGNFGEPHAFTFNEAGDISKVHKRLGLAWPTKEECEAWIKEQEEKNK